MQAPSVLSDDFIDEAQVRFARSTTKDLARYIERAVLDIIELRDAQRFIVTTDYQKGLPCS